MDTKLKRFINRRTRSSVSSDNFAVTHGAPYEHTSMGARQPIFLHQSLSKSASEARRDANKLDTPPIRTLSYDQVISGKAPTFLQTLPQKGNGPIKLQATQMLDTGEITTIIEDPEKTLRDLQNGSDYIVCKRSPSQDYDGNMKAEISQACRSVTPQSVHYAVVDNFPSSPTTNTTWPRAETPELRSDQLTGQRRGSANSVNIGLGLPSPTWSNVRQSMELNGDRRSARSRPSTSQMSSRSQANNNATLEALRKAEFSKLVEMYGHQGAARHISQLDEQRLRASTNPVTHCAPQFSPIILTPLPAPPAEHGECDSRRLSYVSAISESCCDEWSRCSSPQRQSFVSSCADSSATTAQTSFTEDDNCATKEDIRSMVRQMRSHYLSALDQQAEESAKLKARKQKTRRPKLMPSPSMGIGDGRLSAQGRQTWHSQDADAASAQQRRKVRSHPLTGRLSPIEDSPSQSDGIDDGLKRADSETLGALMADLTRSKIRKHAASRAKASKKTSSNPSRPTTPKIQSSAKKSWLDIESDSADDGHAISSRNSDEDEYDNDVMSTSRPRILSHHSTNTSHSTKRETFLLEDTNDNFDSIYQDLFGKDNDDTWSSASASPQLGYPSDPNNRYFGKSPPQRIMAIPESPEYTHLADEYPTEGNFI